MTGLKAWAAKGSVLLSAMVAGALVGHQRASDTGPFGIARTLSDQEQRRLEGSVALAVANASWLLGSADDVNRTAQTALRLLPTTDGRARATMLVRMALIVESADGQGALLRAACSNHPESCPHARELVVREAQQRAVAPGNRLPVSLISGHPPLDGR